MSGMNLSWFRRPEWKPNRSRRITKKLLKRADWHKMEWNMDAVSCDGGKRWVTAQEALQCGFGWDPTDPAKAKPKPNGGAA